MAVGRRWVVATAVAVTAVVAVVAGLLARDGSDDDLVLDAGRPPSSSTTSAATGGWAVGRVGSGGQDGETTTSSTSTASTAPTPIRATDDTAPAPVAERRTRPIADDADAGWSLVAVESGGSTCVELRTGGWTSGSVLCDASPVTSGLLGDLAAFDLFDGIALVAVVDPAVTSARSMNHVPYARAVADPAHPGVTYLVGVPVRHAFVHEGLMLEQGENTLARVMIPATGTYRVGSLEVVTGGPYGVWPGFRFVGMTGLWFGGNEELGFYDGPGGVPCSLYRRFGGMREALLVDACPAVAPSKPVVDVRLVESGVEDDYTFHALTDRPVTGWRCEPEPGGECRSEPLVFADPAGSGRTALVSFLPIGIVDSPSITVVLLGGPDADEELGRVRVAVPGR